MKTPVDDKAFLPDLCALRPLFALVLGVQVLAVVLTLAQGEISANLWSEFSIRSLFILWIALPAALAICQLRPLLAKLSPLWVGLLCWLLILALAGGVTALADWLSIIQNPRELLIRTLGITGILSLVLLRYLYENHQRQQRAHAESRARLQALQARIRPHFLFNSLNTVISLIGENPQKAEEVLYDLSDLFRAALADGGQLSTVQRELELAHRYLEIEQQRLGARLKVTWDVDNLPPSTPMPGLMLQPLLENALYHGIEPAPEGGEIRVYGRYREGTVALAISNSLPGEVARSGRKGNQMALDNIRQRLALHYGDRAGLSTGLVDGLFQVRVHFPGAKA